MHRSSEKRRLVSSGKARYGRFMLVINADGPVVRLTARVKNVGGFRGREVLQVYLSSPAGRTEKAPKALAGFAKTATLAPGESEAVTISWDLRDMSSFDEARACYVLEAGRYIVHLGTSSADTAVVAALDLGKEFVVRKVEGCLAEEVEEKDVSKDALSEFVSYITSGALFASAAPVTRDGLPLVRLDLSACETEVIDYTRPSFEDPVLDNLSDEELAYLNMGSFNPKGGILSVIGDASVRAARRGFRTHAVHAGK